jgi:hypothetical protein
MLFEHDAVRIGQKPIQDPNLQCTSVLTFGIPGGRTERQGGLMNNLGDALRDQVRTLLRMRRMRRVPVRGPKPRIGAAIFRGDVRMTVLAGMTDDLWMWLQDHNWREITFRPERRRYREVPAGNVMRLIDCDHNDRLQVLMDAIDSASWRPTLSGSALHSMQYRR